ncbi:hypothetical protein Ddc_18951 [Ditylenchus destructor]|nr:hypothetical protein Ddc_18951 [Ditylenchus destructor]
MVQVAAIAIIVLGVIAMADSRCEWQSDDFLFKCEPRCLPGWREFYDATPDMVNRARGSWGAWACKRGGTRRLCCQKHIFDENWAGEWFSIKTLSHVLCTHRYNQSDLGQCGEVECVLQREVIPSKKYPDGTQINTEIGELYPANNPHGYNCTKLQIFGMFGTVKAGEANFFTNHGKYDTWIKTGRA